MNLITDASSLVAGRRGQKQGVLVCTIDGFSSFSPSNGKWALYTRDGALFPKKLYGCSCTMHVLHTHDVGWDIERLSSKKPELPIRVRMIQF